jgi:NADPH-dependent 2,4-dienoyl-CoA reductase/sulfur reductase-like enzyme
MVLVGSGPLLLLLAWQLVRADVRIDALVDTTPVGARGRAAAHLPEALLAPAYLRKGLGFLRALRRAGIRLLQRAEAVRLEGTDRVHSVVATRRGETEHLPADVVLLHQGIVPNANLGWALRCEHDWNEPQRCFVPRTDSWGLGSHPQVQFAGDCAGIAGARAAEQTGRLAALEAAHRLGRLGIAERDRYAQKPRAALRRERRVRPLLEALYRPADRFVVPREDEVVVCRCEETTAGEIRDVVAQGCPGPNQMKAFVRCGMGPCQGRLCGLTVTELIAAQRNVTPGQVGYYRIRPPIKPLALGELAALRLD